MEKIEKIINIQTGEILEHSRVDKLKNNALLKNSVHLFAEWDFKKNAKLGFDIWKMTNGNSKDLVWWLGKCGHGWISIIYNRTSKKSKCPYCANKKVLIGFNDMWTTNPNLASMLANPEDGYKYMQNSYQKLDWKCSKCDNIIPDRLPSDIKRRGLRCQKCSDKISIGEKMLITILHQLAIDFERELSFQWSESRRYDFYIPYLNCIIEIHGLQHYKECSGHFKSRTLEEEQENDRYKEELAINNGIEHYIVIDARYSELTWIKNSIENSELSSLISLQKLNWDIILKESVKSILIKTCEIYNGGISNTMKIAEILSISQGSVQNYLREGTINGWCNFKFNTIRKIVQLSKHGEYIKTWNSQTEAKNSFMDKPSSMINECCRGNKKTAFGFKWMYLEDYEESLKVNSI